MQKCIWFPDHSTQCSQKPCGLLLPRPTAPLQPYLGSQNLGRGAENLQTSGRHAVTTGSAVYLHHRRAGELGEEGVGARIESTTPGGAKVIGEGSSPQWEMLPRQTVIHPWWGAMLPWTWWCSRSHVNAWYTYGNGDVPMVTGNAPMATAPWEYDCRLGPLVKHNLQNIYWTHKDRPIRFQIQKTMGHLFWSW